MDIVHTISYLLDINELSFFDWSGVVVLGAKPRSPQDFVLAVAAQLFFTGALGIVFAYIVPAFTSKNLLLKGWLFGLLSWFTLNAIAVLYSLHDLTRRNFDTASADAVSVSLYGVVLAYTFNRMNQKIRN